MCQTGGFFLHMLTGCRWIHTTVVTSDSDRKLISTTCVFDLVFLGHSLQLRVEIDGGPLLISCNPTAFCSHLSQPDPVVEKQLVLITWEKVFLPSSPFTIKAPHSECTIDFVHVFLLKLVKNQSVNHLISTCGCASL